jgi:hypothetical protein
MPAINERSQHCFFGTCAAQLYMCLAPVMMIRKKGFRIGQTVKLHDPEKYGAGNAYPLPDGWHDGHQVTILAFDHGWATVQDANGRQTQVFLINLDTGWEHFVAGTWIARCSDLT